MECPNCGAHNEDDRLTCEICQQPLPRPSGKSVSGEGAIADHKVHPVTQAASQARHETPLYVPVPVVPASLTWGPFAGYGKRQAYGGWFIPNVGEQAASMLTLLEQGFRQSYSAVAEVFVKAFTAHGLQREVEARNYLVFRRGQATLVVYIVPSGKDVFISVASFLKPPLSRLRVGMLAFFILLALAFFLYFPAWVVDWVLKVQMNGNVIWENPWNVLNLLLGVLVIAPLGAASVSVFWVVMGKATLAWIREMDFWAPLRMSPHEFHQDDLLIMHKALEQALLGVLDDLGLSSADLRKVFSIAHASLNLFS